MRTNRRQTWRNLFIAVGLSVLLPINAPAAPNGKIGIDLEMQLDSGFPDPVFSGEDVSWSARVLYINGNASVSPSELSVALNASSFPSGVSIAASGTSWSCAGSICTYQNGLDSGMATNDLVITASAPFASEPGQIDLTTELSLMAGFVFDNTPSNNIANDQVAIDPELQTDYFIQTLDATPDPVDVGENVTFTLVAAVPPGSPRTERGFSFSMDYVLSSAPGGATLVGTPTGTSWFCDPNSCDYTAEILPGAMSNPLTFVATAPAQAGTMTLDALITSDGSPGNNAAQRVVTVNDPNGSNDFLISSISGSPDPIDPAANGSFEVRIERFGIPQGNERAQGVTDPSLTYTLSSAPGGASLVGVPAGTGWSCAGGICTYTAPLPFNTPSAPLLFNVQAPPSGPGSMTLDVLLADDAVNSNNAGSSTLLVNASNPLDYQFSTFVGSPSPAFPGSTIQFQVAVSQTGGGQSELTDGSVGSSLLSFDYDLSGSPGNPQIIGTPSGNNWSCSASSCSFLGSLGDGQTTPPVTFSVQAPNIAPGNVTLQGELFGDEVTNNNSGSDSVPLIAEEEPPVELTLDKSAPATAQIDQDFTYTLTVSNIGEPAATQLQLSDTLPNGLTLVGVDPGEWFCNSTTTVVDCSRNILGSGLQSQVRITVRASEPGDYLNEARLTATDVPIALQASALTRIEEVGTPFVDLVLTKMDSIDPVAPGGAFSYDLTVSNIGTLPATGVTITETFPAGMVLVDARGPGWTCSALNVCTLGSSLLGAQQSTLTLDVLAPPNVGTITNQAVVTSLELETHPEDNRASEQTTIAGEAALADLRVVADAANPSISQGESRLISVIVNNAGPDTAQAPKLRGIVSGPLQLLGAGSSTIGCTISGGSFECNLPALAPGASEGVGITVSATANSGSASVNFDVNSVTTDPQLGNNADQVDFVFVTTGVDLGVELNDSVDPTTRGGSFDYQLKLVNNGPGAAEQATISVNLDPSLSVVSQSTPGLSCSPAGTPTQTCTLSSPMLGSSIRNATFSVQVPFTAADSLSATVSVTTSQGDGNPTNNSDTESTAVGAADEEAIRDQLDDSTVNDPIAGAAVNPTAEQCANPAAGFVDFCTQILAAPAEEVREALAALAPEENMAQATVLRELSFAQFFNVDARLAELRGAGGGFSSAGLNLSSRTGSLGFDQLTQMLGSDERQADDAGGLLSSPWGFFVNGTISTGDQSFDGTRGQVGVDFESRGLTAGVDYRFSSTLVVGAALGYARFDSDVTGDSQLDTTGFTFTGYGSWYPAESFYIDGRVSLGKVELEQARRVRFTLNGQTTDMVARGTADADQFSFAVGAGYHLNSGAWNFTPNASLRYTNSDVDGFTETGAGSFALTYDSTSTDALVASAGMQLSRAYSLSRGVVTPQLSLSWNVENRGDDLAVTGRFAGANGTEAFRFVSPETDTNYGAVGLGFVFIGANGVQAYVNYRTVFGYDDFSRDTLNLGARFEF